MKKHVRTIIALTLISSLLFSISTAIAHPGGLDKNGGHTVHADGWGYPVGSYHYHYGSDRNTAYDKNGNVISKNADASEPTATPTPSATPAPDTYSWETYYEQAKFDKFKTPASENGLADTLIWVSGKITNTQVLDGVVSFILNDGNNDWLFWTLSNSVGGPSRGDNIRAYGIYGGIARNFNNMPSVMLLRHINTDTKKLSNISYSDDTYNNLSLHLIYEPTITATPAPAAHDIDTHYKEFPTIPSLSYYAGVSPIDISQKDGAYIYKYPLFEIYLKHGDDNTYAVNWGKAVALAGLTNMKETENELAISNDEIKLILTYDSLYAYVSIYKIQEVSPTPSPTLGLLATPNASTVYVNGKQVDFDAYTINQENYIKLRDVAYVLNGTRVQFNMSYDGMINLISGKAYTPDGSEMKAKGTENKLPILNAAKIMLNSREAKLTAYTIEGNNYFKLRELAQAFDFNVGYNEATKAITIETEKTYEGGQAPTTSEPNQSITIGQKNALNKAIQYLNYSAFSYTGLIEQLEYEKYSHEEAVYGADNCGADWNEQAVKKAAQYLKYSSFSKQGLIDQLIYEGFTQAQAEYGVAQNGY